MKTLNKKHIVAISDKDLDALLIDSKVNKSQRIRRLFMAGHDVSAVSKMVEVSYTFAYNIITDMVRVQGLEVVNTRRGGAKTEEITKLLLSGKTKVEVSTITKSPYNAVQRIAKKLAKDQQEELQEAK